MNDYPFQHAVAIDTNIFEHLFNPQENTEKHINQLLLHLKSNNVKLLLDNGSRILREYKKIIEPRLNANSDHLNEIQVMRSWLIDNPTIIVSVNNFDGLMNAIESEISGHNQITDRTFVYVAFSWGGDLVSNDERDIVSKRRQLKRKTRHESSNSQYSNIFNSREAYEQTQSLP